MARHALLIGSPNGLNGPEPDVERMTALLEPRGFTVRRCAGPGATRDRILHDWRSLIRDAASGDAVVVYYSGHGARSLDEDYRPAGEHDPPKRYHRFVVPMDFDASTSSRFLGILDVELSSLLGQLTDRTRNVTVVFDCCNAGGLTRDLRLRLKALPRDWHLGAHDHVERLTRGEVEGFPVRSLRTEDNPHAVRLMAALPSQLAWELEDRRGAYGLMTDALIRTFAEAGDRSVTWNHVKRRVRELVQAIEPGQYPDVEGPASRFLFETTEADLTDVVPIESSAEGPRLQAGRLLGIEPGDEYVVMPPGIHRIDLARSLARATVSRVGGSWALVTLDPAATSLPAGAQAFPASRSARRRPVVIDVSPGIRSRLESAIAASGLLRLPTPDEDPRATGALAVVEERGGRLHLREQPDLDLITPLPADAPGVAATVAEMLGRLARARRLETLESGSGPNVLAADYTVDWGRVVAGAPEPLERTGARLFTGDRIYVRAVNRSPSMLYVSAFDVGLAGRITLLTRNVAPSGVELAPDGAPLALGYREPHGWIGIGPLSWPADVPRDGRPRPESLVVILSDVPQDLRALESPGMAVSRNAAAARSGLERLIDQVATGRSRDLAATDGPIDVGYAVEHITMLVERRDPTSTGESRPPDNSTETQRHGET